MTLDGGWSLEVETDEFGESMAWSIPDPYQELDEVYSLAKQQLDDHFRGTGGER